MIYTVISSLRENRIEQSRDCRVVRQPLSLLPIEIKEYIDSTKNEAVRAERAFAYTTLLCGLKAFFDIEQPIIERTPDGKPYIKDSSIRFSLSHSDGTVAVCLSDEGEVGVDLQSEISPERAERLGERFFKNLLVKSQPLSVDYYFCRVDENEAWLDKISPAPSDVESFTAKWTVAESLMKLCGGGFGDITSLPKIAEEARSEIKLLEFDKKYSLAISVKK